MPTRFTRRRVIQTAAASLASLLPRAVFSQPRAEILHDPDINAYNSFENQNRVVIRPHPEAVEIGRIRLALPAMSVASVTLQTT